MDRFDPFVKYADVYGDIINWEKDPMNKPQNQNKYFFSDGKTYYEQICKMLRLMSVFKEAFNQIYSNEDEISEAWENFVNNLSASVVEGSEPDVTLTWTDDSVNFEFTMVPGVPGEQGVGITSISFNSDYTMTITLSDGNTYTSMSLKGETGPQGPQGETGSGLQILDVYPTLADLQSAHPTGQPGDAYQVGSAGSYTLYIWSSSQSTWVPAGSLGTVSPSLSNPLMDGTASAGSQNLYSRGDHVHPTDTSRASKEELDALIKISQSLIDQSFTYRKSPAIQDGLARFDKIKGNTLVWNQLIDPSLRPTQTQNGLTCTNNNDGSFTITGTSTAQTLFNLSENQYVNMTNHKVLLIGCPANGSSATYSLLATLRQAGSWRDEKYDIGEGIIFTSPYERIDVGILVRNNQTVNLTFRPMFIDLSRLGIDSIINVNDFKSLFPNLFYEYNAGSLLSFNGTGLKTVGKNRININDAQIGKAWNGDPNTARAVVYAPCFPNTQYTLSFGTLNIDDILLIEKIKENDRTVQRLISVKALNPFTFITGAESHVFGFQFNKADISESDLSNLNLQIEFGPSASSYKPYDESTLSLPISTYFLSGMKSAEDVYDELRPAKAITRIKSSDMGSLPWTMPTSGVFQVYLSDAHIKPKVLSEFFKYFTNNFTYGGAPNYEDGTGGVNPNNQNVYYKDNNYTSVDALKSAMSGKYLNYELATPTEASISPELDLSFTSYEDGTEQLLPVNGSVPSTSPVIADMTYLSIDDAMEYVLEKLANVPQNTQQILESLEDDVADLQTDVGALQPAVSGLQTSVGNINTNIGQLSSTVAGHTASISDMQSDITDLNTGLSNLEDTVTDNTSRIGTLETDLASTDGQVQSLGSSVSTLSSTVSDQGTDLGEIDSIIQDISNNPVISALGSHELGFVAAYVDATLPANTGTRVTIPKPTIFPNNYTPLFIVGMSTGAYNVSICEIPPTFGNSDSVNCRVWNHGSQQTTQITVYILCMRQRQSQ